MRHWLGLAGIYALVAALILPGSLLAQEEAPPAPAAPPAETTPTEPAPAEPVPVEPAPAEPAPAEPATAAPAPPPAEQSAPAPDPAAAGEQPAPAPAEPVPAGQPSDARAPTKKAKGKTKPKVKRVAVAAATTSVTISDFEFSPAQITIQEGDTVTWTNDGPTAHSATASDGSFDTGIFSAGGSRSHTFDEPGTFAYICTPHPNMEGTVVVEAASTGDSGDTGTDDTGSTGTDDSSSTGSGTATDSADDGTSLPATGADAAALAILGLLMLALGIAIQRRAQEPEPPSAG
jgi:LPXTG-motif cell wall-anchored protein